MKKQDNLAAFKRIWTYVWRQWGRVVSVVIWSFVIAAMFTVSFATILPLLKVMMGEEGLHGWVDRKVCNFRYGMDFYLPDITDYQSMNSKDNIQYYLLITKVDEESWAAENGLTPQDRIVGAGKYMSTDQVHVSSSKLLEILATVEAEQDIPIQYRRTDATGLSEIGYTTMKSPPKPAYADWMQWPVSFLPRNETKATKMRAVIIIILAMSVVTLLRCIARFYQTYLADKIVHLSTAAIREDLYAHIMKMPVGFFSSKGTSDTTSRLVNDVNQCGIGIKVLLGKTLREPLKAIGTLGAAFVINWQLTAIFIAAAPLTIGAFAILGRKIKKATKKSLQSSSSMLGHIQETLAAMRVIKVYNREEHETQEYREKNNTFVRRVLRVAKIDRMSNPLMEVLGMAAGSGALIFGATWVAKGHVQGSQFFTLLVMLGSSADSIRKVSDVWNRVQTANAAAERVFEVFDQEVEHEEEDAFDIEPLKNEIKFKDIVFTYPQAQSPTLNKLNLEVQAGQTVAVVGPNGSGKSTLVNLIPRFYDPDSGQILIDGQDIHKASKKSLRGQIAMVTQNIVTFNETIANNIAYSNPQASREEIINAAKQAYAHEFIELLPDGYDTMIGEHSSGFSGGQLQRIIIARAILKNPPILIFDEAMSQIDADSEMKIHNALSELSKGRTCFLIAHRFSTVISADKIVVVDQGEIAAQGTHEELMVSCGVYKRLYETQLMS